MRRLCFLMLVILALSACKKDEPTNQNTTDQNQPTATSGQPTLPPQQTVDPLASPQTNLSNQASVTPRPTLTSRPNSNQPTLPPVPTSTATPTRRPTATDEATATSTFVAPTEPANCTTFRPDVERNPDTYSLDNPVWLTLYWFAPQGQNLSYSLRLYDSRRNMIFEQTDITATEYTFDPITFPERGRIYYWTVSALENARSLGCTDLDGEIVISQ